MPDQTPSDNQWSLPGQQTPPQQPSATPPGWPAMPPAAMPQQPVPGYQQHGGYGPQSTILLTLQGSVLTSNMITPKVEIDGYPVPAAYGANYLPVPSGRHTVSAHATWIVKYGQASYDVDVAPGQTVPVFYAAPLVQFVKGRMGPVKQKRAGLGALILAILVIIVVVAGIGALSGS